jgi:hypothetical protein
MGVYIAYLVQVRVTGDFPHGGSLSSNPLSYLLSLHFQTIRRLATSPSPLLSGSRVSSTFPRLSWSAPRYSSGRRPMPNQRFSGTQVAASLFPQHSNPSFYNQPALSVGDKYDLSNGLD